VPFFGRDDGRGVDLTGSRLLVRGQHIYFYVVNNELTASPGRTGFFKTSLLCGDMVRDHLLDCCLEFGRQSTIVASDGQLHFVARVHDGAL